jgi:transposase
VLCRNDPGDRTRAELAGAGYRRCASDGTQEMWVRDRNAETAAALERETGQQHRPPAVAMEGRGL